MQKKNTWFSDEWFWKTYGPIMFDEERMAQSRPESERIIEICGLKQGDTLLDCCCGMGRHSIELSDLGLNVTALDLSKTYIHMAKEAAELRKQNITFVHDDVLNMKYDSQFDCITNMFTSFGYFDDPENDLIMLRLLQKALKKGGSLFMEMWGKEVLARDFEERTWFERENIKIMLEYSVDLNWTTLGNRWLFYKDDAMTEYFFSHRIFSAAEMAELLWKAGFDEIEIYGDFDQSPYDHKAQKLILRAIK